MATNYEYGDQVEARIILWWQPGEKGLHGRTVVTHWRGDTAVDSQVGTKTSFHSAGEVATFALLWANALVVRYNRDLGLPEDHLPMQDTVPEMKWLREDRTDVQ